MIDILKNLFKSSVASSDGLNQKQREALIDFLLLCTYADNHLSLAEDNVLKAETERFNWKSGQSVEDYIDGVTPKVRQVHNEEESRRAFIGDISDRLDTLRMKAKAIELSNRLFRSDGNVAEGETKFGAEIREGLGL